MSSRRTGFILPGCEAGAKSVNVRSRQHFEYSMQQCPCLRRHYCLRSSAARARKFSPVHRFLRRPLPGTATTDSAAAATAMPSREFREPTSSIGLKHCGRRRRFIPRPYHMGSERSHCMQPAGSRPQSKQLLYLARTKSSAFANSACTTQPQSTVMKAEVFSRIGILRVSWLPHICRPLVCQQRQIYCLLTCLAHQYRYRRSFLRFSSLSTTRPTVSCKIPPNSTRSGCQTEVEYKNEAKTAKRKNKKLPPMRIELMIFPLRRERSTTVP